MFWISFCTSWRVGSRGPVQSNTTKEHWAGSAEREKSILKIAGVKANYCGWDVESSVRRQFAATRALRCCGCRLDTSASWPRRFPAYDLASGWVGVGTLYKAVQQRS